MTIDVGSKAPAFDLETDTGRVSLDTLKGKTVVLYFYPKDDTPGCTNEGKDFSALWPQFHKAGATVIGASKDSVKAHAKFPRQVRPHRRTGLRSRGPDHRGLRLLGREEPLRPPVHGYRPLHLRHRRLGHGAGGLGVR